VSGPVHAVAAGLRPSRSLAVVLSRTRELWDRQNQHEGDRWRLFRAVGESVPARRVLYPGSYVDISPSLVFPSVTYVDVDRRAAAFFSDEEGVRELIHQYTHGAAEPVVEFLHADYTTDLGLEDGSFDLLVSLYAGFVSEACTDALRVGGTLLVNPSHGDAAMAAIDPRYQLCGVVTARSGDYRVRTTGLDTDLIPKKPVNLTRAVLRESGRGVAYTKPAFAYLFTKIQ
jgi:hypothetical protein